MHDIRFPSLPVKERKFLSEYLVDFNERRAAKVSNIPEQNAYKLLYEDRIQAELNIVLTEIVEDAVVDKKFILSELKKLYEINMQMSNYKEAHNNLKTMMTHIDVDALAKNKVEVDDVTDRDMVERLRKGRLRAVGEVDPNVGFL